VVLAYAPWCPFSQKLLPIFGNVSMVAPRRFAFSLLFSLSLFSPYLASIDAIVRDSSGLSRSFVLAH